MACRVNVMRFQIRNGDFGKGLFVTTLYTVLWFTKPFQGLMLTPAKGSFSDPSFGGPILWLKVINFWEAGIMGRLEGVGGKPSGSRTRSSYIQVGG